ncbi:MAG: recombinase XerC, partial [Paracoccaceae bacterium]
MSLALSPAARKALESWLEHEKALNGAAENTVKAYRTDLLGFLGFLAGHFGEAPGTAPLSRVGLAEMRAWMA